MAGAAVCAMHNKWVSGFVFQFYTMTLLILMSFVLNHVSGVQLMTLIVFATEAVFLFRLYVCDHLDKDDQV
jgi:hypothetical protein